MRKKSEIIERKFKTQNPDELQLAKMKSLKGILTAPDKKLRLDTLNKCEDVLHKLYEKVEGPPPVSSTTVSVSGMFYKQWLKFGFSEKATKFEKILVVLLTRASCSLCATAYLSRSR